MKIVLASTLVAIGLMGCGNSQLPLYDEFTRRTGDTERYPDTRAEQVHRSIERKAP